MEPSAHVKGLREVILAPVEIRREECELLWARSWLASAGEPWNLIRRGRATADVLRGLTVEIGDHEVLVGRFPFRQLSADECAELEHWRKDFAVNADAVFVGTKAAMKVMAAQDMHGRQRGAADRPPLQRGLHQQHAGGAGLHRRIHHRRCGQRPS